MAPDLLSTKYIIEVVMKKLVIVMGALLFSGLVVASEPEPLQLEGELNQTLPVAPEETVRSATDTCNSWAKSESISDDELPSYLLECVNDELQGQGYQPVSNVIR